MAETVKNRPRGTRPRQRTIRGGAVLALALAAGFVAWLLIRNNDDTPPTANPPSAVPATNAQIVSVAEIRALSRRIGQPIYWAGRRPSTRLELTRTGAGRVYVRYLPPGARAGVQRRYLTVGTYPFRDPQAALRAVARRNGTRTIPVPGGGIALETQGTGTSVYLAYPNEDVQVEVFAPSQTVALEVATSGQVRRIPAR